MKRKKARQKLTMFFRKKGFSMSLASKMARSYARNSYWCVFEDVPELDRKKFSGCECCGDFTLVFNDNAGNKLSWHAYYGFTGEPKDAVQVLSR